MKTNYSMGIMNFCSHDPACALIREQSGDIDFIFAEEGFLSRKKKSYHFPIRSMKYCLDYFGIKLDDLDILMLDFMDKKRVFRTSNNYRLLVGDYIRSRLNIDHTKVQFVSSHHYAHALTAFWPSKMSESAVLIVDGLGSDQQTHSIFNMDSGGKCELVFEQKGYGIGALYSKITTALGFEAGEEGKTMGLAPYGKDIPDSDYDFEFLKGHYKGFVTDYGNVLDRNPSVKLKIDLKKPKNKKDIYNPYFTKLAFELQKETENCLIHLVKHSLKTLKTKNLCFAGGVALNCVANNRIQNIDQIKNFWVQPASGDSGIPLGLALAGLENIGLNLPKLMNTKNRKKLSKTFSIDTKPLQKNYYNSFKKLLKNHNIKLSKFNSLEISKKLANKNIVSLYSEGIELGPRALGHRSFLADARSKKMKDVMNSKIKHREGYRPFAPIILQENFYEYFTSKTIEHPHMLQAPLCKEKAIREVPAICHIDNTSRVQTIADKKSMVFEILTSYKQLTNVPLLINTSFNDNDEPIVFTKIDALCAFLNCNADILILDDVYIDRKKIQSFEKFKKDAERLQENFLKNYFISAINELTNIKSEYNKDNLKNFILFNSKLSKSFREDRMTLKLIDFLFDRESSKLVFLDNYHMKLIQKISKIIGFSTKNLLPNHKIIEDNFRAISLIQQNSDFILYNISGFYHSKFTCNFFNNHKFINSFYELNDKKVSEINSFFKPLNNTNIENQILNSYEYRKDHTIKQYFANIEKK